MKRLCVFALATLLVGISLCQAGSIGQIVSVSGQAQAVGADAAPEPSAEENEAIYAQLKALGYME